MTFAPFGLTIGEWATIAALIAGFVAFIRKGFIPWLQTAIEQAFSSPRGIQWFQNAIEMSIASDRGVHGALQEALKPDLAQVTALRGSVDSLTETLNRTNEEHKATRRSFSELHQLVHDLRTMVESELREVNRRMSDYERGHDFRRRAADVTEAGHT